jgi:hypothetical protein
MPSKQRIVSADFLLVYLCLPLFVLNRNLLDLAQPLLNQGLSQATLGRTRPRLSLLLTKQSDADGRSDPGSETFMRRLSLVIAAVLTLSGASAEAQTLARGPLAGATLAGGGQTLPANIPTDLPVAAGQASYVTLGGAVRDVVVGDPSVADVSVVNERTLVVLGKRPGVTSLLAFGAGGRPLVDRQVVVSENGGGGVTIYRGAAASNYACAAQCTRLGPATASPTVP